MSRTLLVAAASALLLAAAVTELSSRLFPGSYFALLILTFIALLANGLFNVRQLAVGTPAPAPAAQPPQQRNDRRPANAREPQRGGRDEKPAAPDSRPAAQRRDRGTGDGKASSERRDRGRRDSNRNAAPVPSGPREDGTVKWFDRSKGFGFIIRPDGEEIFVHQRSLRADGDRGRPNLNDGAAVSYVVTEADRGRQAEDVTLNED